jgi:molecular chaperone DnaJ
VVKDHYQVLCVKRNATQKQIKKAYKKMAKEYHPDTSIHKDAYRIIIKINKAYSVLKTDRENYDIELRKDIFQQIVLD